MICKQVVNAESDFALCVNNLLSSIKKADSLQSSDTELPKILWSLYFTIVTTTDVCDFTGLAENIYPCTGPDLDLDYDISVKKVITSAQRAFLKLIFKKKLGERHLCEDVSGSRISSKSPRS